MGGAMFPPSCLTCSQTTVEVMKIIVIFFKMSHVCIATLSVPNTAPGHHQFTPLPGTPGHSQASLGQSLVGSLLPSPGSWCAHFVCVLQESLSLALKFWWLYGGVNGDFLQEGLCHTQVCCTWSPWPGPPQEMLTVLCLCGVSGSWCAQGLFEPSERLWRVWGLVLNAISPLLPSCWSFSFVLGCGVSPQSRSSTTQPPLQRLPSCWGFSAPLCHSLLLTPSLLLNTLIFTDSIPIWSKITSPRLLE